MATQLALYNRALTAIGERRIATLSEANESRRVLDDLYGDCVQFCLEQGMWNFAMIRTGIVGVAGPVMNYAYQVAKPSDLVHLFTASADPSFDVVLATDFIDQQGYWFTNAATLYVRYTSNHLTLGGGNLALWTQTFATYFAHVLAAWAAVRLTGSQDLAETLEQRAGRYLVSALAIDSVPQLPGLRPFNAEARAKPVEGHTVQPIDLVPFHAPLRFMQQSDAPAGGRGDRRGGSPDGQ